MEADIQWMRRALQLAANGLGNVSPNPMVGCVIVHEGSIIGEGWHRQYGGPHAEVWAIHDAESKGNAHLLPEATAYVTLEPCSHTGKTPPCADLIVSKKLKKVIICNSDPNPLVSGRGIARMIDAGIEVKIGLLPSEGLALNKRFFTAMEQKRPYVILKWAETADGFLAHERGEALRISGMLSNMRVHQWRTEEDAILVGYKTALMDNPRLNVRNWEGRDPVRVVLDRHLQLPATLNLFNKIQPTIVVNYLQESSLPDFPERYSGTSDMAYLQVNPGADEIEQMLIGLLARKIQSVFVEGGAAVIHAFLQTGLWDEIRRCQGPVVIGNGVKAPTTTGILRSSEKVEKDLWTYYSRV
ncbi:bifunctional diaminohydroxyphosphoribosylaminopyrimidine deaminase/5-amino-6-(5-phosphoribosylamino)uracil reductase RibD [Dyadobacter fanqingshengii]|uniref:Riboflavin biosynthesis protein RibD n=1 Tax=Dyadobacter fanqingshengii TaxID=2906443 RepID=A0A9X1P7X3_9BACT|nr:bifunctional diaminohydroxyphosphoribosylaminopyrimidine deaminase/5-amino-6-(5-phosphoribosylamino)uracil reductase RibD [Dyadobacter fanqingshengii]MCF0038828.1 bifunctional diaminohydroxyphosphoribosylaminopyrimidine deaminase/5-amino-6-(5-phosphoribosylamino)uracil reductase RibD [Dyadobacter fanqingshengii]USJ34344.1 bifunctional diaminohydroxyphosphoribosylaminopyrimidine deaminase/5-amino-6-(5-phosphoribosylamino)uracil reductase RibD [Dyadobacter fanqingshengii]